MEDVLDIVKNIQNIYDTPNYFEVLKDFERCLDELDLYVYKNWEDGELAMGPKIGRHWVECTFIWPRKDMPDPMGGKRLLDYDCEVQYKKTTMTVARKIKKPDDVRPGTKKGKLDSKPIWAVTIKMPKKLMADLFSAYAEENYIETGLEPKQEEQPADAVAAPAVDPAAEAGAV